MESGNLFTTFPPLPCCLRVMTEVIFIGKCHVGCLPRYLFSLDGGLQPCCVGEFYDCSFLGIHGISLVASIFLEILSFLCLEAYGS